MKKSLHGKTVKNMPTGTKIVTYICLAWALIISLVPLVWLGLSSLKKDPMQDQDFNFRSRFALMDIFLHLKTFMYFVISETVCCCRRICIDQCGYDLYVSLCSGKNGISW